MGTRSPGHSGKEASEYAADHLWTSIDSVPCECDKANKVIVDGFKKIHEGVCCNMMSTRVPLGRPINAANTYNLC